MTPWMSRVEVFGGVDGRLARDERHHHAVAERQDGDRLVFNECGIRCAVGGMPLGDDTSRERVEPVSRLTERRGQFGVAAGQQCEFVAGLGAGEPRFFGRVAQGSDVELRTNEEPPFLNKLIINHALPMLVDGEPAMQWIAARFDGEPTAPNCGQF